MVNLSRCRGPGLLLHACSLVNYSTRRLLLQGHWERPPYDTSSMKSAYHIRQLDGYRLLQIHRPLDIFLSHDWPRGIAHYGNKAQLFRAKPFLQNEVSAYLCYIIQAAQTHAALGAFSTALAACLITLALHVDDKEMAVDTCALRTVQGNMM